jgi:hypothetical protein
MNSKKKSMIADDEINEKFLPPYIQLRHVR